MPMIFVADLPEFLSVTSASRVAGYEVSGPISGYWCISAPVEIRLRRKELGTLGMGPALWNSILAGGIVGKISHFDRTECIVTDK